MLYFPCKLMRKGKQMKRMTKKELDAENALLAPGYAMLKEYLDATEGSAVAAVEEYYRVVAAVEEYYRALRLNLDTWVPACGGMEVPGKARNGHTYLFVFNPRQRQHAWLNMDTDIVENENPFSS